MPKSAVDSMVARDPRWYRENHPENELSWLAGSGQMVLLVRCLSWKIQAAKLEPPHPEPGAQGIGIFVHINPFL